MKKSMSLSLCAGALVGMLTIGAWAPSAGAYSVYETSKEAGDNCAQCHPGFQGGFESSLHDAHLTLTNTCSRCHISPGDVPQIDLNATQSRGCAGCHGRLEDGAANIGAGLRLHHESSPFPGPGACSSCHFGDPAVPVGENVSPPFFAAEGLNACSDALDNDGDLLYDGSDLECVVVTTTTTQPSGSTTTTTTLPGGGCPAQPDLGCEASFKKGLLLVNEKNAGKEKLIAKWIKGPALAGTDFGNPLGGGGTAYNVCVYDDGGNLAGEYTVDRAGDSCAGKDCWKSVGKPPPDSKHKGYKYNDKGTAADGMLLMLLKGGGTGKSKVLAKGKNDSGSLPTGIAAALSGSVGGATVQLFGSDAPKCISVTLPTVLKAGGQQFKAKKP